MRERTKALKDDDKKAISKIDNLLKVTPQIPEPKSETRWLSTTVLSSSLNQ